MNIAIAEKELKEKIEKFDFSNIPKHLKGPGKFYRAASVGLWKKNFNAEEQEIINSIMRKPLEQLNYE